MSQTLQLIATLKQLLKAKGKTYAAVAEHLGLSESSVKRQFAQQSLNLRTLEAICAFIQLEFVDLIQAAEASQPHLRQLSEAQEAELVTDPKRVLVAVCVLNHWNMERIVATYCLSDAECIRHLLELDRIGLIRLLPENRIKLRIERDFEWRPDGPIHRFFQKRVQGDFLDSGFNHSGECLLFQQAMLSPADNQRFQKKMRQLLQEFTELHQEGVARVTEERDGTSLLLALRPWEPLVFQSMRRVPDERKYEQAQV
ncbi:helix-turn-helix domain-containing protein [Paludibacterium denitrificans]|uniref:Helix-turn-helix domain-containing protein n=1 Tax=Paludibacterium denitrificans TaxID=2675226 RepID=A0A844GGC4_9NEIS|nr:helix-turn-helix transcriptional regulator [Paludibacterium denitrificans]MTD33555.1 helix-turn-helix domain-containing protein [Paludibacterium denitrificans]